MANSAFVYVAPRGNGWQILKGGGRNIQLHVLKQFLDKAFLLFNHVVTGEVGIATLFLPSKQTLLDREKRTKGGGQNARQQSVCRKS